MQWRKVVAGLWFAAIAALFVLPTPACMTLGGPGVDFATMLGVLAFALVATYWSIVQLGLDTEEESA